MADTQQKFAMGWRPSLPDIRDALYQAPLPLLRALPPSIDLSNEFPGQNLYQYKLGSCGPQTAAKDIMCSEFRQTTRPIITPSRLFIYYNTRKLMGTINSDSGVDNRSMLKALVQYGWCDETLWPYDESKFMQQPPQACYDQAIPREDLQYLSVSQDLQSMRACLAGGDPFLFGFSVYSSMLTHAVAQTGIVPMPSAMDRLEGGHDVLFIGYDDATQRFKFLNHWPNWGVNNFGYMPYSYATSPRLAGDFWTVQRVGGVGSDPAPTPIPTPIPTPTPTPIPAPGPSIKDQLDAIFAMLKLVFGKNAVILSILNIVQEFVDKYLSATPNSLALASLPENGAIPPAVLQVIDAAFAAAALALPQYAIFITLVQHIVDMYLSKRFVL